MQLFKSSNFSADIHQITDTPEEDMDKDTQSLYNEDSKSEQSSEEGNDGVGDTSTETEFLSNRQKQKGASANNTSINNKDKQILNKNTPLCTEKSYHKENCCHACRNLLLLLIKKIDQLALRSANLVPAIGDNETENYLDILPISDKNTLETFDKNFVRNEILRKQFEKKISPVGGDDFKKAVDRVLKETLTDEFAEQLTWVIKRPGKTCVAEFDFHKIISNVLIPAYTCIDNDIKNRVQKWIQKSGDRIRNTSKKRTRNED